MAPAKDGILSQEGEEIKVAPLQIINLSGLLSKEPSEVQKLLGACKAQGFFYLDFSGVQEMIRDDWKKALSVVKDFYDQPLDAKIKYYRGRNQAG
jgi:isopenicillin N synthase-like dioxygenase